MKITKARFENFNGFFTGMNLKVLNLDFESNASNNPITMVFGKNRSGKSCLISMLQPFPGTNDIRKNIIMDDENGKKVIEYLREDGERFKCEINYIRKESKIEEKCFFYKKEENEWKNLNPSGRIGTYTDCLLEHLKVTKDYFTVGRIGGISNFIDLSKSDRKKYIANFLPDIDPYLKIHKITSEKFSAFKKQISSLTDDMLKLASEEVCNINIEKYEKLIEEGKTKLDEENNQYGFYKGKIDNILTANEAELPELREFARTGKNSLESKASFLKEKIANMEASLPENATEESIASGIEEKEHEKRELERNLAVALSEKDNARRNMNSAESDLNQAKTELAAMENKEAEYKRHEAVFNSRKESMQKAKEYLEKFTGIKYKRFSGYNEKSLEILKRDITDCRRDIDDIRSLVREADAVNFNFFDHEAVRKAVFDAEVAVNRINKVKEKIGNAKTEIPLLEKQAKLEEVLDKRPANCTNDSCPFIEAALGAKGSKAKLAALRNFLESPEAIGANSPAINSEFELNSKRLNLIQNFGDIFTKFSDKAKGYISLRLINRIQEVITDPEKFVDIINGSDLAVSDLFNISDIEDYVNALINYNEERKHTEMANASLSGMKNVQEFVDNLKAKFNSAQEKYNEENNKYTEKNDLYNEIEANIKSTDEAIGKLKLAQKAFESLNEKKSEYDTISSKIEKMNAFVEEIANNRDLMIKSNSSITTLKSEITENEKALNDFKFQVKRREEINAKLAEIQNNFKTVETLKIATDTVKGIPIYLIDTYLEDIRIRANHLLDLTFNGSFQMDKFVITEKEFSIPVIKGDGSRLEDALEGSGAEISFIKESLSFAIIEKAIAGYNIVSLDEVDGVLDEANRIGFIRMLKKQISDLGIEQVFIISHNREFLEEGVNMILFKDHGIETNNAELMRNKNVIFDFYA